MTKRIIYILSIFTVLFFSSCQDNNREPGNPEGDGNADMRMKSQQRSVDSVQRLEEEKSIPDSTKIDPHPPVPENK